MAGRRPKPTKLRLLTGNAGKRPINNQEPQPPVEAPEPPEHLNEIALAEWQLMTDQLIDLHLMTKIDRSALAAYCVVYARWVEAERAIQKTGPVVKSPSGYPILSPFYTIANQSLQQMRAYLIEFGMTPASRSRLHVSSAQGKEADPAEKYFA